MSETSETAESAKTATDRSDRDAIEAVGKATADTLDETGPAARNGAAHVKEISRGIPETVAYTAEATAKMLKSTAIAKRTSAIKKYLSQAEVGRKLSPVATTSITTASPTSRTVQ